MKSALQTLKHNLICAGFFMKLNVQADMEYPTFLVGWFISNALQFVVGVLSLKFITNTFQAINGWSFAEILFMYGIGIISHALSIILFIQTWYLEYFVTQGEFDRMLVRPLGVFMQYTFAATNLIGLTDLVPGLCILLYGTVQVGLPATPGNIGKILAIIAGATLIRGGLYVLLASVSFWTKRGGLTEVLTDTFAKLTQYPLSIYGKTMQALFTFLIPIGFICFYPASAFLGKDAGYQMLLDPAILTPAVGVLTFVAGMIVFKLGMKRYESAGS